MLKHILIFKNLSSLIILLCLFFHSSVSANVEKEYNPKLFANIYIYLESSEEVCPVWNSDIGMHLSTFEFQGRKINFCHFYKYTPNINDKYFLASPSGESIVIIPISISCGTSCYFEKKIIIYSTGDQFYFATMLGNQNIVGNHYNKRGYDWWLIDIGGIDIEKKLIQLNTHLLHITVSGKFNDFYRESFEDSFWQKKELFYFKKNKNEWFQFTPHLITKMPFSLLENIKHQVDIYYKDLLISNKEMRDIKSENKLFCKNNEYRKETFKKCIYKTIEKFISNPVFFKIYKFDNINKSFFYNVKYNRDPNSYMPAHCKKIGFYEEVDKIPMDVILRVPDGDMKTAAKIACTHFLKYYDKRLSRWLDYMNKINFTNF